MFGRFVAVRCGTVTSGAGRIRATSYGGVVLGSSDRDALRGYLMKPSKRRFLAVGVAGVDGD